MANFCANCGVSLQPTDRFCAACGARVADAPSGPSHVPVPPPPPVPPPAFSSPDAYAPSIPVPPRLADPPIPMPVPVAPRPAEIAEPSVETIVGTIPQVVELSGFLGSKSEFFILVATTRRLIFAVQSDDMFDATDAEEKKMEAAFVEQEEDWAVFAATYQYDDPVWHGYLGMDPDTIVAEHRKNRVFQLADIVSGQVNIYADPDHHASDFVVRTDDQEWPFELPWGNGEEAYQVLSQVLPQMQRVVVEP